MYPHAVVGRSFRRVQKMMDGEARGRGPDALGVVHPGGAFCLFFSRALREDKKSPDRNRIATDHCVAKLGAADAERRVLSSPPPACCAGILTQ